MTKRGSETARGAAASELRALVTAIERLAAASEPEDVAAGAKLVVSALARPDAVIREAEQLAREADERIKRRALALEAELRAAVQDRQWTLSGVWPNFHLEHAVPIEIVDDGRSARVAGGRTRADAKAIVDAAAPIVRGLIPKNFSEAQFLIQLAAAVDAVAPNGAAAPIRTVYRELVMQLQSPKFWQNAKAELFEPLGDEQFRARLSRLLAVNARTPDGRLLRISPALNPKDGVFLWLPGEDRFAHIGRLQMVVTG